MNIKRFIFIFVLSLFQYLAFSQQSKIDSLLTILKTTKQDIAKVNLLNTLFLEYEFEDDALANDYLNKAFQLAQSINYKKGLATTYIHKGYFAEDKGNNSEALKNYLSSLKLFQEIDYKVGIADSYNSIGVVYNNEGDYSNALKNYFSSLKIFDTLGSKKGIAATHNNIGLVLSNQGNNTDALKHYFSSMKIFQEMGDKKSEAKSYNNIGNIYRSQGNYQDALKNHSAALKIRTVIKDKSGIASSYNNIGNVYFLQGNYEEALKNYEACLKIREETNDISGIADSYANIGIVNMHQTNYSGALKNYSASLKLFLEIGDQSGIAAAYGNIGNVYMKQKKFEAAEENLFKAKELSKKIGYKEYLKDVYAALTGLDSAKGNYKGAYENHKLYILYRDSIDNEETRKKTIQSQMTFDFEKKEAVAIAEHKKELENQEILAEEKSRKQRMVILFVVIGLGLVLVFAGFVFRSLRITRKQKSIIELQKNEVEQQKHLIEEHQKDIIDSITYAKRLQQAILPSHEEIKKQLPHSFLLYQPKDIVAGDFYWLHVSSDENIILIAAADSTGHGVPGAMVSVVCSNALNRAVNEFNLIDTGKILDKTRDLVLETFAKSGEEIKDGMDISLLSINKNTNQINWSGANNALWYFKSDGLSLSSRAESRDENKNILEIKADKQPIGKTDNPKPFTTHAIGLNTGDTFYLMTDGYPDQFGGEKGKKYKYKQLQEQLVAINHLSLAEQHEKLLHSFAEWKGNLEQVDDVTIIGIRV